MSWVSKEERSKGKRYGKDDFIFTGWGTDPVSIHNYHDGAMIHIARFYKPDVIYMFLSKEILETRNLDDRYRKCIRWLGEALDHPFEIVELERPELENAQLFDPIYEEFEKILDQITGQMGAEDELILNITSGTPAMKSALLVLATMVDIPCKCVQVDTPQRAMNTSTYQFRKGARYDDEELQILWDMNPDNGYQPGEENYNRTHEESLISLKRLKYEETIRKYVTGYNYHAAYILAGEMNPEETGNYLKKLELADARQQMDFPRVDKLLKETGADRGIYSPVLAGNARKVYEYMLTLQARVERGEYADFIRAVSPIFLKLFEEILRKRTQFHLDDFTVLQHEVVRWNMNALNASGEYLSILNQAFGGHFEGGWVKSVHLVALIKGLVTDPNIIDCVEILRNVEEKVRNTAAHNMVAVSDAWVKEMTDHYSRGILSKIREAFGYTSYNIKNEHWESYQRMNEDIISSI